MMFSFAEAAISKAREAKNNTQTDPSTQKWNQQISKICKQYILKSYRQIKILLLRCEFFESEIDNEQQQLCSEEAKEKKHTTAT